MPEDNKYGPSPLGKFFRDNPQPRTKLVYSDEERNELGKALRLITRPEERTIEKGRLDYLETVESLVLEIVDSIGDHPLSHTLIEGQVLASLFAVVQQNRKGPLSL